MTVLRDESQRWLCRATGYILDEGKEVEVVLSIDCLQVVYVQTRTKMAHSGDWVRPQHSRRSRRGFVERLAGDCIRERELMWLIQAAGYGLVFELKRQKAAFKFEILWTLGLH